MLVLEKLDQLLVLEFTSDDMGSGEWDSGKVFNTADSPSLIVTREYDIEQIIKNEKPAI